MKKLISTILVVSVIFAGISPAISAKTNADIQMQEVAIQTVSDEIALELLDIPVFITYIDEQETGDLSSAKESALSDIEAAYVEQISILQTEQASALQAEGIEAAEAIEEGFTAQEKQAVLEDIHIEKREYEIVAVEQLAKEELLASPVFADTFLRAKELIDDGITINYLTFFVNDESAANASRNNDPDDPAYWRSVSTFMATYNGYEFRFMESSASVTQKNYVRNNTISPSLKWDKIFQKTLQVGVEKILKGTHYDTGKLVAGKISTLLGFVTAPLAVTYGESGGYVEAKVEGNIYLRSILIQDKDDKIPGYAFYSWGAAEQARLQVITKVNYPVSKRLGGTTFDYDIKYGDSSFLTVSTPGFVGNIGLYSSILQLYQGVGNVRHIETLDLRNLLVELVG